MEELNREKNINTQFNWQCDGFLTIKIAGKELRQNEMTSTASRTTKQVFFFFGYPVGEEELSLGSQEVGQIPVFAVFHYHHQRTCLIEAQHEKLSAQRV